MEDIDAGTIFLVVLGVVLVGLALYHFFFVKKVAQTPEEEEKTISLKELLGEDNVKEKKKK